MGDFDYRLHKIIGVARKKYQGAPHASIYPLGYQDDNYHFQPFSEEMRRKIFLHNGTIFGYKFPDYWIDKLIMLDVKEEIINDPSKDRYLVASKPAKYEHTPIVNINKQDLEEAVKQGLNGRYFKVGNRIYFITNADSKKGIAKYWPIEDGLFNANDQLCRQNDDVYLIRGDIQYPFKYSDLLSDEEIIAYIIEVIKLYKIDINNIQEIPNDLIKSIEIPSDVLNYRFNVFKELLPSIVLTHKYILDLASNPILSNVLQKSIKEYEDEYIKTYEEHHRETIKKIEKEKEQRLKAIELQYARAHNKSIAELAVINKNIEAKKLELNDIINQIRKKEADAKVLELRFSDIEKHKNRLIEDFSIIRDVIGEQSQNKKISLHNNIESVMCDGTKITEFKVFDNHITLHLLKNKFSEDSSKEIAKNLARLFVAKNEIGKNLSVILLPCLTIFKSLIDAIGQYKLRSVCVGVNWKSFDDLYFNALEEAIVSANNYPNEIHLVLLQNMNLSYIPSYMQPINDILIGISSRLPGNNNVIGIPPNLWIFGTRTAINEEAIPISKSNIEAFGCLENKEYTYNEYGSDVTIDSKFITMEFVNSHREECYRYKSAPDTYLD